MADALNLRQFSYSKAPTQSKQRAGDSQPYSLQGVQSNQIEAISVKLLRETASHHNCRMELLKYRLAAQSLKCLCEEHEVENRRLNGVIQELQTKAHAKIKEMDRFQYGSLVRLLSS
jgi:hypothetical protein